MYGLINFAFAPAVDYHAFGDIVVDYIYDPDADVIQLRYRPLDFPGTDYPGLLMNSGPFNGSLINFRFDVFTLAYIENPYPVYTAPIPSTVWLFASGLLALIACLKRAR